MPVIAHLELLIINQKSEAPAGASLNYLLKYFYYFFSAFFIAFAIALSAEALAASSFFWAFA